VALGSLTAVRLVSAGARAHLAWAEGVRFTVPSALLERPALAGRVSSSGDLSLPSGSIGWTDADVARVREQAAFTDRPPVSSRLPFRYHLVPGAVRAGVAAVVGRWQRRRQSEWAQFPGWPLDLSADFIADAARDDHADRGTATPVVLSHDIDSAEGLTNLVDDFLPCEEAAGARSTNYVVPCAWPLDHARIAALVARGHEVGVHGYDHSNRTAFASADERARRLDAARPLMAQYAIVGYRAPSLLRTRALLRDLSTRFQYDSSIPTSGGPFPVPNNGCATARPFVLERIAEIPLSMPRDGSLRFLGYSPRDIARLWIECAELIAGSRGVVMLLTHCERRFSGTPRMLSAYRRFLDYVAAAGDRYRFVTAASLWRERFDAVGADDR
jgi:peptidoglycan/xylan/chitin deacetylase (PgdA/CDA1 family)